MTDRILDQEFISLQEVLAGRYSLQRELGRGGMGIVYLAHEVALDRPVALKLLPPAMASDPELRERFMREARTAAKLSQPNIVPIYTVDDVGGFVFFTMAYVNGISLGAAIRDRGPLPSGEANRVLREVAWALAYAHGRGVVHRDVKPDNILLETGGARALVTDFGIAQVGETPDITGKGEVLGTAEFMSPEQANGETVDERSDIYSLGVVGYHILTGRLPFESETPAAVLAKHITQAAPPLSSVAPEVPRYLAQAIDRCLLKAPADRFANAEDLAAALSQSIELRREIPLPLRVFLKQNREQLSGLPLWALFVVYSFVIVLAAGLTGEPVLAFIMLLMALTIGVVPIGMLLRMARLEQWPRSQAGGWSLLWWGYPSLRSEVASGAAYPEDGGTSSGRAVRASGCSRPRASGSKVSRMRVRRMAPPSWQLAWLLNVSSRNCRRPSVNSSRNSPRL
jgi:serine/threonine-protein kinase